MHMLFMLLPSLQRADDCGWKIALFTELERSIQEGLQELHAAPLLPLMPRSSQTCNQMVT